MKLDNLYIGLIIKNYKELCNLLNETEKGGKSKQLQLREWERFFKYSKQGNKFIIEEIYEKPKEKIDNRGSGNNRKEFNNFLINLKDENENGVYCIREGNDIYIGSTTIGFRRRFLGHNDKSNELCTYNMLKRGATFEALWFSNVEDEWIIRSVENEYIKHYKKNTKFNVINTNEAWSYTSKEKYMMLKLKIQEKNYKKAIKLLRDNELI